MKVSKKIPRPSIRRARPALDSPVFDPKTTKAQGRSVPPASTTICITEYELARRTTLSTRTLQIMRVRGDGPPFAKLGGRVVYRLADVERWIAERLVGGGAKS